MLHQPRRRSLPPETHMNILLLGSGGREHALAWKIAASPLVERLYCAPGNAGIAQEAEIVDLDIADHKAVIAFCRANKVDFVVVGPEARSAPAWSTTWKPRASRPSARTRWPRSWKAPRASPRISAAPTISPPPPMSASATSPPRKNYVRQHGAPIVIKADGLAAGKGVVVAMIVEEARSRARHDLRRRRWRGRHGSGGGGIPQRRGSVLLRALRRRARDPAGHRAGPQARLRRRQGPQYRRHGRLFARADDDGGDCRAG